MACFAAGHACLSFNMPQHRHLWDVLSRWCHELSLIFVCERGKQKVKVKAVNVKYFEVAWFGKWGCAYGHSAPFAKTFECIALSRSLINLARCWSTFARTGKPMEVVDSGIMRRVQGFFISMQSVYSTLWSVLPGMLRYSDAWPFITKSHDQTDRVLSSIFSPYVQFNFSTDAGRLINSKFIQFVLTLLIFSVKCQYQVPKGCSIFDKDIFSCWFFKHKAVAYVPLARCSTLEAALTAISIFIAFGVPKSPYESTNKYEYDSVWLIWWPRDACCYLCGHAAHPLWGWRTFAKAGLEE